MEALKELVISVSAGGIIAAIACGFFGNQTLTGRLIHLTAGLFLTLIVIQSALSVELSDYSDYFTSLRWEGEAVTARGKILAREAMEDIIKTNTETYILDKAEMLGAALKVEVTLNENNLPAQVRLEGAVSPYTRSRLQQMMEEDLAVAKENQHWIG